MASFQPVRLAYNTYQPLSGTDENLAPVIFLHGLTGYKETWEGVAQQVANVTKRTAYTVDARNHGESEWSDHFNFDVNADDLIHFMDARGIEKAVIVGQSMGGKTAIKTALGWPDRVEKIVSEDMGVRESSKEIMNAILRMFTLFRKALEEAPPELDEEGVKKFVLNKLVTSATPEMKAMMAGKKTDANPDTRNLKLRRNANGRYTLTCNMEVIEKSLQDVDNLYSKPEGKFDGPACFIYGKLSPFLVGADEHHIKQFFPNAVFEGIEEAGHDVHHAKPLEFTDVLLKFLQ